MSDFTQKPANDTPRIGVHAATQPVSGVRYVNESFAVSGCGHAGTVAREDDGKIKAHG